MIDIKGFLETSFLDWPGKICSVLFLPYCNLRCPYCHNHSLVFHPERLASFSIWEVLDRLSSFKGWIDGICITGGEPTLHATLPSLIREIKREGFLVKLDTNGTHPRVLERLVGEREIDYVAMDVKAPLDVVRYRRAAGVPLDLNPILESIDILKRGGIEYQFRMTVVPGIHRTEDVQTLANQLRVGKKLVLQNFNPENPLDPDLKGLFPFDLKMLREIENDVKRIT
jgi:pyruvate formate lyase activating enzyme